MIHKYRVPGETWEEFSSRPGRDSRGWTKKEFNTTMKECIIPPHKGESIPPSTGSCIQGKTERLRRTDNDHVWIDGKQYISLTRVGQMIEESRQSRNTGEIAVNISTDTTGIDKVLEKFREMEQIYDKVHEGL
jgi:hypothetical protein